MIGVKKIQSGVIMRQKLWGRVGALAFITAIAGPAVAADIARKAPPPAPIVAPACEWCGFYVGGSMGYGWSRHSYSGTDPTGIGGRLSGLAVGLQSGYNWQVGAWVLGIESDATITPWEKTYVEPAGNQDTQTKRRIDWLSSVRGRLGWAFDRTLIYATGGVGWIGANTTQNSSGSFKSVDFRAAGGVVGGGVEWKYNRNISLRVEALEYIFNKTQTFVGANNTGGTSNLTDNLKNVTVIRTGLSWYFSPY